MGDVVIGVRIKGKDQTSPKIKRVQKAFKGSFKLIIRGAKGVTKAMKGIGKAVFSLKGLIVGVLAGAGVKKALDTITTAAFIQEKALLSLGAAARASGVQDIGAFIEKQKELASAIQGVTRFGDEAILQQQALAVQFGVTAEQLETVTRLSVDLAAGPGKNLEKSFRLVSRAIGGDTAALRSLNIVIDQNLSKTDQAAEAIKILQERFGGLAEQQAKSLEVRITQAKNSFGDLNEQMGFVLTQNKTLNAVFAVATKRLGDMGNNVEKNRAFFSDLVTGGIRFAFDAIGFLIKVVGRLLQAFKLVQAGAQIAFGLILKGIRAIIFAFFKTIEVANKVENAIRRALGRKEVTDPILEGTRDVLASLDQMIDTSNGVRDEFLQDAVDIGNSTEDLGIKWAAVRDEVLETARTIQVAGPPMAASIDTVTAATNALGEATEAAGKKSVKALKEVQTEGQKVAQQISDAFTDTFIQMAENGEISAEAIGKTLKDLAKSIINDSIKKLTKSIIANATKRIGVSAAEGAAGAGARTAAETPFPANLILPGIVAASVFALILGFKGKFARGGIVGSAGRVALPGPDNVPILASAGEAVLPVSLTRALRSVLSGGPRATPPRFVASPRGFQAGGTVSASQAATGGITIERLELKLLKIPNEAELDQFVNEALVPALKRAIEDGAFEGK